MVTFVETAESYAAKDAPTENPTGVGKVAESSKLLGSPYPRVGNC